MLLVLLSGLLLGVSSPPVVASGNIYTNLKLVSPIPQTIASNTIAVDIQQSSYPPDYNLNPSNFPSEYKYKETIVSVCDSDKFCGNYGIAEYPRVQTLTVNGDYQAPQIHFLSVSTNRLVFSFEKTGKYFVNISKRFSREARPLNRDFWGNRTTDWLDEKIIIPIEITDVSKGGIDIKDLNAAGIGISPYPVLKCPEKIKNLNQTITCGLSYTYENTGYKMLVEPYETFKVCSYKVEHTFSECDEKQKPYFSRKIELDFNSVSTVKIPINKDVDTAIYLRWDNEKIPYDQNKADFMYYFNKPKKYSPVKKGTSSSGRWEKKCRKETIRIIPQPGELTSSTLSGGGGLPLTTIKEICENVWVPKR